MTVEDKWEDIMYLNASRRILACQQFTIQQASYDTKERIEESLGVIISITVSISDENY